MATALAPRAEASQSRSPTVTYDSVHGLVWCHFPTLGEWQAWQVPAAVVPYHHPTTIGGACCSCCLLCSERCPWSLVPPPHPIVSTIRVNCAYVPHLPFIFDIPWGFHVLVAGYTCPTIHPLLYSCSSSITIFPLQQAA